jgi:hypothetical protein
MSRPIHEATVVTAGAERPVFAPGTVHGQGDAPFVAHARDVEMVPVDGKVAVDDHRLPTLDAAAPVDRPQAAGGAAWGRFAARHGGYMAS